MINISLTPKEYKAIQKALEISTARLTMSDSFTEIEDAKELYELQKNKFFKI